jgi:hypothetical protein
VRIGRRALDLVAGSGDPVSAAFERANLAELHLLLGEVDVARMLAEEAVTGAEGEAGWILPYALIALGRVRAATGDPDDAARLYGRAAESAERLADRQAQREASAALSGLDRPSATPPG